MSSSQFTSSNSANEAKENLRKDICQPKELELLNKRDPITAEDVLELKMATENYLCSPDANIYNIEFTRFKIRDMGSNTVIFEVAKQPGDDDNNRKPTRFVRYNFPVEFLDLDSIGATIEFTVGNKPVKDFRMIERHFFNDKCLKTFDFFFGFCVPDSRNTCEQVYELPHLEPNESNTH
jgi:hypothetical protein